MLITSLDNERVKKYLKLQQRKFREKTGEFLVEGHHLVMEAFREGLIEELILEQDELLPLNVPTIYVTSDIIHKISTLETPSNVLALCKKKEEASSLGNRILLLDQIQDPGNLGTIIRSACAFHVDTIVLGKDTVDLYNPKTIRATQGMLFHVNIIRRNLEELIHLLKKEEIPVYGTKVEYGMDVRTLKEKDRNRYALVMGNEGSGVSSSILEQCDSFLYIAMNDEVESLNVAVATSILLYELDRGNSNGKN